MHFLLKFRCPGQLGNHFSQPTGYIDHVQIISDNKDAIKKQFRIFDSILKYFHLFSGYSFHNVVGPKKSKNELEQKKSKV